MSTRTLHARDMRLTFARMMTDAMPAEPTDAGHDPRQADRQRLETHGQRLTVLLEELRGAVGPQSWPRVEELVQRLSELYGAGLERTLAHMRAIGGMNELLSARLCEDALVSSLLLLHGLHPDSTEDRVRRALEKVAPQLKAHSGSVTLRGVTADGVVELELHGTCNGCPSSTETLNQLLRVAIEEAAPETTDVRLVEAASR